MGLYGSFWVSVGPCGPCGVPMCPYGSLCVAMGHGVAVVVGQEDYRAAVHVLDVAELSAARLALTQLRDAYVSWGAAPHLRPTALPRTSLPCPIDPRPAP